jgi:DNA-binding transcriptional MerR regulator
MLEGSALRTFYTVQETALIAGVSEKALRRRIERKTLPVAREGRRVFVSHAVLRLAGLVEGRRRQGRGVEGIQAIIDVLRRQPRERLSAWQLQRRSGLSRQRVETVMAGLTVAGRTRRELSGGIVWRWAVPD